MRTRLSVSFISVKTLLTKMFSSLILVTLTVITLSYGADKDSACVTPNGETAKCVPVDTCLPIKRAIAYLKKEAVEFARQSQCGYDETPLVCCGTTGHFLPSASTKGKTTTLTLQTSPAQLITTTTITTTTTTALPPIQNTFRNDRTCGTQSKSINIQRTKVTSIREFPWMVSLGYSTNDGNFGGYRCTGTLINRRYVLTAAECLNIQGFDLIGVRLGKWNYSDNTDCFQVGKNKIICALPIDLAIDEKIAHPNYDKTSNDNNIGLLRLTEEVDVDDFIRPICLPPMNLTHPRTGVTLETSGWNIHVTGTQQDVKMKGEMKVVDDKQCETSYSDFAQTHPHGVCVEAVEDIKFCVDNSGSPAMKAFRVKDSGVEKRWFQEGIVYKGFGCSSQNHPAGYTRVSKHMDWIASNVRK